MVQYTVSKPPSAINPEWIFWSKNKFGSLAPKQVSSILFITRKKEICVIYKPTPILNKRNKLTAIIRNMFDKSSSPAFFNINKDDIGSHYAICDYCLIPAEFKPEIALQADLVKETDWDDAKMEIALIAIPTIVLLPFGMEITSTMLDDDFIDKMKGISNAHSFWAQTMANVIDQFEVDNQTEKVLKRIISSPVISTSCDPARAATKGLRNTTFTSTPFPNVSLLGKNSYEADQEKMKAFYRRNPTPAHASSNHNVDMDDEEVPQVPVHSTTAAPAANPPPIFFAQLIETMKNIQVPQRPSKIIVESRDYEETTNLAKLQNGMLQLFYATGDINWDDDVVKNIKVATFLQGF